MSSWKQLGDIPPSELTEARLELHWALQLVAMGIGRSLVVARADDSHTALIWRDGGWFSEKVLEHGGLRAGLKPARLELHIESNSGASLSRSLFGLSLQEGLEWLREAVDELGGPADEVRLDSHFELPPHPIASGGSFREESRPALLELERYFSDAAELLKGLEADVAPIRTWPHHFDIALLLPGKLSSAGVQESVGVGLSPGDGHYPEPYFYVAPWPPAKGDDLPPLKRGSWQTESFFGAVLTATELLEQTNQEAAARVFVEDALAASRTLLSS